MAFPQTLDNFTNPTPSSSTASPVTPLSGQLSQLNNAVEAIEGVIGVTGSTVPTSIEYRLADVQAVAAVAQDNIDALLADLAYTNDQKTIALLAGQEDETYAVVSCTITSDTTNFVIGDRAALMTMTGAVTGQLRRDFSPELNFGPAQAIGISIYLPDATKVTSVGVDVYQDSGLTILWSRSKSTGLVNGWNHFRFLAASGTITSWGVCHRLRVLVTTNASTTATIGHVWAEVREKASIMIINDGPYSLWIDNIYPWFRERKLPVVLAVDTGILGTGSGLTLRASENQILALAADGNGNEVSFHGYLGDPTSAMTAAQLKTDMRAAQRWLMERGFIYGALWRAAYVQNLATNAASCSPFLMAQATSTATTSSDAWPPINADNVPRMSVHGRSAATMDTQFDTLQKTRGLYLFYYHNVDDSGGTNATTAEDAYLKQKIQTALDAGWLEVVTFRTLFERSGGKIVNFGGRLNATWPQVTGAEKSVRLI